MSSPVTGALLAFAVGLAISALNYLFSRYILRNKPAIYVAVSFVRQLVNIGYLLLIYFCADMTPWDVIPLLIGGALGVTLPMFFFTFLLLSEQSKDKNKGE